MTSKILTAKLSPPVLRAHHIDRPQLIERLNANLSRKLTLLCAPAGFGKSALLSEWILQNSLRSAWLSLDDNDNVPASFLEYLFAACHIEWVNVAPAELEGGTSTIPKALKAAIAAFSHAIAPFEHPLVLILDNYHVITNDLIHRMITLLIENVSAKLHLVIASRIDPPLPLARLWAREQMGELRINDLRFTFAETLVLFEIVNDDRLSATQIRLLYVRTEGWIEGLHIASLLLRELDASQHERFVAEFTGSNRYVSDYLFEEVFNQQSAELQMFLLQTSLLDRLNGPLCRAITGQTMAQKYLERLEEDNLFVIPLDAQRNWYRYHQLFGDFLRHRLHQTYPDQLSELHRRASQWCEENGLPSAAIRHAMAGFEWGRAMYLIDRFAESTLIQGHFSSINRWTQERPVQSSSPDPLSYDEPRETSNHIHPSQINALALGQAYLRSGQVHKAAQLLTEMNFEDLQLHNVGAQFTLISMLSESRIKQGKLHLAVAAYQPLLDLAMQQPWQPYLFDFYLGLYRVHYEWNQLQAARQYLQHCVQGDAQEGGTTDWSLETHIAGAWLLWAEGQDQDADAAMQKVEQLAQASANPHWTSKAKAHRAKLDLKQGNHQEAARWAQEVGLDPENAADYRYQFEYLTLASILTMQGQPEKAIGLLEQLHASAVETGRAGDSVKILAMWALAQQAQSDHAQAFATLAQAVCEAEREGFVRTFVDEGPSLKALLHQVAEHGITRIYIQNLLAVFPQVEPTADEQIILPEKHIDHRGALVEPLSQRELEVLHMVAAGHSNREIAKSLQIATSTVKKHVGNILGKLGVKNRTRAAVKARELDLL